MIECWTCKRQPKKCLQWAYRYNPWLKLIMRLINDLYADICTKKKKFCTIPCTRGIWGILIRNQLFHCIMCTEKTMKSENFQWQRKHKSLIDFSRAHFLADLLSMEIYKFPTWGNAIARNIEGKKNQNMKNNKNIHAAKIYKGNKIPTFKTHKKKYQQHIRKIKFPFFLYRFPECFFFFLLLPVHLATI